MKDVLKTISIENSIANKRIDEHHIFHFISKDNKKLSLDDYSFFEGAKDVLAVSAFVFFTIRKDSFEESKNHLA